MQNGDQTVLVLIWLGSLDVSIAEQTYNNVKKYEKYMSLNSRKRPCLDNQYRGFELRRICIRSLVLFKKYKIFEIIN